MNGSCWCSASSRHLVRSVCCISAILISAWWHPIVLICSSLMPYDIEHPFLYLFVIYVSSLVRCLSVQVFCPFLNCIVHFSLQNFKRSLYTLDNIILSDISFANIFSQSVAYLHIFLDRLFILMSKLHLCYLCSCNLIAGLN